MLKDCKFYDKGGWLPARTHGWYSTMEQYDSSTLFPYEQGYSLGYRANVQLREGERLTRNWFKLGLHVNMGGGGGTPGCVRNTKSLHNYSRRYGDIAPGRIGNGTREYVVPLADGTFRRGALQVENLTWRAVDKKGPALRVTNPERPGILVLRMPSSYVYLGGELVFQAAVSGGEFRVLFSDNHGLDWQPLAALTASGEQRVDLKPFVYRRYDYRLKFVLKGPGTGLDSLRIRNDIQHSQRPLPALAPGKNTITFSAGPQEGTITIEGSTDPKNKGKQLIYTDFHPTVNSLQATRLVVRGKQGDITFPIRTPGEMVRLRFGCFYRAHGPNDHWDFHVSFDGGKSFRTVERAAGPVRFNGKFVSFSDIPPGTKEALVRFAGSSRSGATLIFNFRIDADYKQPHGGFRPVKVTYVWTENGAERRHVHVAKRSNETYRIRCGAKSVMKSLIVELAE